MVKALADRLAEALLRFHERVRKVYWGYAPNENLSNEELIPRKPLQVWVRHRVTLPARNIRKKPIWELLAKNIPV